MSVEFRAEFGQVTLSFKAPVLEIIVKNGSGHLKGEVNLTVDADEFKLYSPSIERFLSCEYRVDGGVFLSCERYYAHGLKIGNLCKQIFIVPAWECQLHYFFASPPVDFSRVAELEEACESLKLQLASAQNQIDSLLDQNDRLRAEAQKCLLN